MVQCWPVILYIIDVKVDSIDGNAVTYTGLMAGIIHAIACTRVYSTGTTATNIVGIY